MNDATYIDANQRYLSAALDLVCERLALFATRREGQTVSDEPLNVARARLAEVAAELEAPSLLDSLASRAGLSPFERDVVLLCAGVELSSAVSNLCARAHGDPRRAAPSAGLALAALEDGHMSAFAAHGRLRQHKLVDIAYADGLLQGPMRCDERIVFHLLGLGAPDERLRGIVDPLPAPTWLPASYEALRDHLARTLQSAPTLCLFCGPDAASKRLIFAAACDEVGAVPFALRAADLVQAPDARNALAVLWEREALLEGAALLVEHAPGDSDEALTAAIAFARRVHAPLVLSVREPVIVPGRDAARLHVPTATYADRKATFAAALGPMSEQANGSLDRVVSQFHVGSDAAASIAAQLRNNDAAEDDFGKALWDACRTHARPRLDELAERIEPRATLDDLVLPAHQLAILAELGAQAQHRITVYERWGFEKKSTRGLGINALFSGPSGTGKTMAAEVLAGQLGLDLYRIDLSQVVSKYIGETEKNLRRVFDAADVSGCVLLFDEADALFGKRSEVKDSHDRYANIEVGYLLQRMEAYRGIAILTTNAKDAIDAAFMRRLRFTVHFLFPDVAMRLAIWKRAFPAETPVEALDTPMLARMSISGGNIRNIALGAAFLAAERGEPIRMGHVLRAARREYEKLGRPLTEIDLGGAL